METKWTMNGSNDPTYEIIGCAIDIHRNLGPGLLESSYEQCLAYELVSRGYEIQVQAPVPVIYKNVRLECAYRIDIFVEELVIIEIKVVEQIHKIHHAQLLTYMKLAGAPLGLIINFNSVPLKNGIKRFVL